MPARQEPRPSTVNGLLQSVAKLGVMRIAALGGVALAMIAFFVFITTKLGTPGMSLLYGELDLKDSAQIVQKLDAMSVPYQLRADGAQILVPADQVARVRMAMAEQGLPHGGTIGYELFDKSDSFGTSTFAQNINQLRALEGELERTISGLGPVQSARVHLVLPTRELFQRDSQEASGSIVVKLRGNQRLGKNQVAAIEHLVASAVPGLKPTRVAIVDGDGNLLARGNGDDPGNGSAESDELKVNYENRLARRVEDLLERSLGPGKVRVDVHADMDFDRVTTSSETFDPDGQVVISTQSNTQNEDSTTGSASEQPVTVTSNLPGQAPTSAANSTGRSKSARNEETTNYGNSKTVRTLVHDGGEVRRLSVAVLVDGTYADKSDGTKTYTPRSADEMKQINTLVRSAIGFNEKRGDTLDVVNLPFVAPEEPTSGAGSAAPSTILGFERSDIMRMGEMLVIAVVALLVILLVVRPLMFRLLETASAPSAPDHGPLLADGSAGGAPALPPPPGMQQVAAPAVAPPIPAPTPRPALEQMIDIGQVDGRVAASSIRKIGEIVEKHPEEAVAIVRSWMYQGA